MSAYEPVRCVPPNYQIDRILETDYVCAEITILWLKNDAHATLLFAIVELLHQFLEKGSSFSQPEEISVPAGDGRVQWCRIHLPPQKALEWYRRFSINQGKVPFPIEGESWPAELRHGVLGEDPPWPWIIFEEEDFWLDTFAGIWGNRPGGTRRHDYLQIEGETPLSSWNRAARDELAKKLNTIFPMPILARPVLLGSAHFLLPNPIFRSINLRLADEDASKLLLQIDPWPGQELDLELFFRERRLQGSTNLFVLKIKQIYSIVELSAEPATVSIDIVCAKRGIMYSQRPASFFREIRFNMGIATTTRRIAVPARNRKSITETYTQSVSELTEAVQAGSTRPPSARQVASEDYYAAQERARGKEFDQQWFDGNADGAAAFLRTLLNGATQQVRCIDPYFDITALRRIALSVSQRDLPIEILTSEQGLGRKHDNGKTEGHLLLEDVEHIIAQDSSLKISIRVAIGNEAPFHDRFLCIDSNIWLLGSSFNSFGERGSMIVRLPAPSMVRPFLDQSWNVGTPLAYYIAAR